MIWQGSKDLDRSEVVRHIASWNQEGIVILQIKYPSMESLFFNQFCTDSR